MPVTIIIFGENSTRNVIRARNILAAARTRLITTRFFAFRLLAFALHLATTATRAGLRSRAAGARARLIGATGNITSIGDENIGMNALMFPLYFANPVMLRGIVVMMSKSRVMGM